MVAATVRGVFSFEKKLPAKASYLFCLFLVIIFHFIFSMIVWWKLLSCMFLSSTAHFMSTTNDTKYHPMHPNCNCWNQPTPSVYPKTNTDAQMATLICLLMPHVQLVPCFVKNICHGTCYFKHSRSFANALIMKTPAFLKWKVCHRTIISNQEKIANHVRRYFWCRKGCWCSV